MNFELDEEQVMNARLTVTFDKNQNICAMQKGGKGTLTPQLIVETVQMAKEKAEEIRKLVVKNNGSSKKN